MTISYPDFITKETYGTPVYSWTGTANASTSVETVGGFQIRKNLFTNPSCISGGLSINGYFGGGGDGSISYLTSGGPKSGLTTFARLTVTTAGTWWRIGRDATFNIQTGTNYIGISGWVRTSTTQTVALRKFFRDDTNATIAESNAVVDEASMPANTWVYLDAVFPVVSGATKFQMLSITTANTCAVGDTLDTTGLMVFFASTEEEARAAVNAGFFDGSTTSSTSVHVTSVSGEVTGVERNLFTNPQLATTTNWYKSSMGPADIVPVSDLPGVENAWGFIENTKETINEGRIGTRVVGLTPGATVTVTVSVKLSGSLLAIIPPTLAVRNNIDTTWLVGTEITSTKVTQVDGAWHDYSLTFTVPEDSASVGLTLWESPNIPAGSTFLMGRPICEYGESTGDYFDSTTPDYYWINNPYWEPRTVWDGTGERKYELGVDHGVLYLDTDAVNWNGLTGVTVTPEEGDSEPYYIDGVKRFSVPGLKEINGSIEAYTAPLELAQYVGEAELIPGVTAYQQKRRPFNFAYRTLIGNDVLGQNYGYKIHILYNVLAEPAELEHTTIEEDPELQVYSWDFTTTPIVVDGYARTSYFTIDSTKVDPVNLAYLESIMYGYGAESARLPLPDEILTILSSTTVGG